jgi:hypothetical protein
MSSSNEKMYLCVRYANAVKKMYLCVRYANAVTFHFELCEETTGDILVAA